MASVIPISRPPKAGARPNARKFETSAVPPADVVAAMDEHTQRLLRRSPKARRGRVVPLALVLADLLGLSLAYVLATVWGGARGSLGSPRELDLFLLSLPCWILVAHLHGLYHRDEERPEHRTSDDITGVLHLVTIGAWVLLVASRIAGRNGPAVLNLAAFWILAVCLVPLARTIARRACKRTAAYEQNTLIVGAGDIGQLIARKLLGHPEYGANVVGFLDRAPKMRRADLPEHISILGDPDRLAETVERLQVERVIVAFSNEPVAKLLSLVRELRALNVQIDLVPWLYELVGPRASIHAVEGLPLVGLPPRRRSASSRVLKRVIDIVGAGGALIVLAPLMAVIALAIRRDRSGPVVFRQTRLGAGMREFTLWKFRTMKVGTSTAEHREYIRRSMSGAAGCEANGLFKLDRSDSVTRVGKWLRRTSLDELPQLINVLKGDMSLVGPRPCIAYEAENFEAHHLERFAVPQGMTGLWQVTARASCTYAESLELDLAYVRDWTLGLDLLLLLRTPLGLLRHRATTV